MVRHACRTEADGHAQLASDGVVSCAEACSAGAGAGAGPGLGLGGGGSMRGFL